MDLSGKCLVVEKCPHLYMIGGIVMNYNQVSHEQLLQTYREGSDEKKREILESGIDVLDFIGKMDSPEMVEALTLAKDKEKILTELIESPDKHSEFLQRIDSRDIQNEIKDLSKNKLVLLLTGKYNSETKETRIFLGKMNDLVEKEMGKSRTERFYEQKDGENNLANQGINPNISKETYIQNDMENNYESFVDGQPQDLAKTAAELEANSEEQSFDIGYGRVISKGEKDKIEKEAREAWSKSKEARGAQKIESRFKDSREGSLIR